MRLQSLSIPHSTRTDLGLKHYLAAVEPPTRLRLHRWNVSDAGLKELAGLRNLQRLDLWGTQVTDAGVEHLKGLTKLQVLQLDRTQVTDEGVKRLQEALPNCKIER
jgi:hypothetical protein